MTIHETYDYLVRARRDLWSKLEELPEEVLSRPLLNGDRFHCIRDLVFHIPDVEDGWINGDIRRQPIVQEAIPLLRNGGPFFADVELSTLLQYWRLVEQRTLAYFATLSDDALKQPVEVEDWPGKRFTVDGLLSHVMIHEMRHTAQICVLLRTQNIDPPSLDLLFYL